MQALLAHDSIDIEYYVYNTTQENTIDHPSESTSYSDSHENTLETPQVRIQMGTLLLSKLMNRALLTTITSTNKFVPHTVLRLYRENRVVLVISTKRTPQREHLNS